MNQEKIASSRQMFAGPVFGVRRDVVIEPSGMRATRDIVTHSGSVVVIPVFEDGSILLVRQYRHSVGRYLWELTAGRMEPDESPATAARRELAEETGYRAKGMRRLLEMYPTPGFVSERMVLYLAEGLRKGNTNLDADEQITTRRFRLKELVKTIRDGRMRDAKSVAGLLYYSCFCARGK
jgi:ADP-ribose pyrophosphatase